MCAVQLSAVVATILMPYRVVMRLDLTLSMQVSRSLPRVLLEGRVNSGLMTAIISLVLGCSVMLSGSIVSMNHLKKIDDLKT